MKPRSILVTGCAGFIGSNFVREFRKQFPKTTIVGIDDLSTGRRSAVHTDIKFVMGSILDTKLLKKVFGKYKPEYVFHFAALPRVSYSVEHPFETTLANIAGTVAVFEAARDHGVKRVVYSSSSAIYGGAKKLPTKESENPPAPISPYGFQKYAGEPFAQIFSNLYGLDSVCLRYFNVYGPGQYGDSAYSTVVSAWLDKLYFPKKGKQPFLEGDGKQTRDFCYVGNVVQANILAMKAKGPLKGAAINIAHGERTSLLEVKDLLEEYTGRLLDLEYRDPRLGDVRHTQADISKARKLIGYKPSIKFEEGLKKTVEWYESRTKK